MTQNANGAITNRRENTQLFSEGSLVTAHFTVLKKTRETIIKSSCLSKSFQLQRRLLGYEGKLEVVLYISITLVQGDAVLFVKICLIFCLAVFPGLPVAPGMPCQGEDRKYSMGCAP